MRGVRRGRPGVLGLAVLLSAASAATSPAAAQDAAAPTAPDRPRVSARLPSFRSSVLLDTLAARMSASEHEAPPAVVWPLLLESIRSLDPELAAEGSPARGWAGTTYYVAPRRLAGSPTSRWLDCGMGMTGRYADTHRVSLAFAVFTDPLPDQRTRLHFALTASAVERSGSNNNPVSCESTGALEEEVRKRLNNRLALKP